MKLTKFLVGSALCLITLSGCSTANLDGEAKTYVTGLLDQQISQWDPAKIASSIDPTSGVKQADVEKVFSMYTDVVGPIKSVGKIERTNFQSSVGINVPDYRGQFRANLTCAKGPAVADFYIVHKDGKWSLMSFNVMSDAFKKVNQTERKGAQEFVDKIAKQICETWKIETLTENGDKAFIADMNKESAVMKGLFFGASKTLGTITSFSPSHFYNIEPFQGQMLYNYVAEEQFEKGRVVMKISVLKSGTDWKIRGFHVQSNSGTKK